MYVFFITDFMWIKGTLFLLKDVSAAISPSSSGFVANKTVRYGELTLRWSDIIFDFFWIFYIVFLF